MSETITCIVVMSFGKQLNGKNDEFLAFMEAADSAENLVKVAIRENIYKCLEAC